MASDFLGNTCVFRANLVMVRTWSASSAITRQECAVLSSFSASSNSDNFVKHVQTPIRAQRRR